MKCPGTKESTEEKREFWEGYKKGGE